MGHARSLPFVDGRRVGVVGGSHGGSTALATMLRPGFAAAVALYPGCPKITYLNAPGGRGATTGGDPAAWADSIREVLAFFRTHLGE